MRKRIVITGATGLVGKQIALKLINRGDEVVIFTRSVDKAKEIISGATDYINWNNNKEEILQSLEGSNGIIHLAGENVMSRRWSEEHKRNIYSSRISTTKDLVDTIKKLNNKPEVFVCASAIGYYGINNNEVDEYSKHGNDFLSNVVKDWEFESKRVEEIDIRNVNIRTGIVLDNSAGALAKMLIPFNLFIGGSLGSGNQWFPWIHIEDIAEIFIWALDNTKIEGAYNGVSPGIVTMNEFTKTLGSVMKRPSLFRVPEFVLKIVLGEGASSIINGAKVLPIRTLESGYKFRFDNLENALIDLL